MKKNKQDLVDNRLGFLSRVLAQVSLPHSEINTHIYQRQSGQFTLSVTAGVDGLPYGSYPRLLLAWLCSEAVKTQSPNLHLGTNQSDFLKKLNISRQGSTIAMLKNQTTRLLNSTFKLSYTDTNRKANTRFLIASSDIEFWSPHTQEWETHLILSKDFFDDIVNNPVPLDLNVLNAVRKSPLAMDVYTWLVYRSFGIYVTGNQPVKISWRDLQAQFGSNYGGIIADTLTSTEILKKENRALINFRSSFLEAIKKLQTFYPEIENKLFADSQFLTIGGAKLIK